jgi:tripartite-type tricarboxylate transporter receptor subunit TctC
MPGFNYVRRLCLALTFVMTAGPALSQNYPSRPIRLIVPYAAGGSTDQLARVIQQPMADVLGQPVIVENKPGAGGTIGVEAVVRAEPDGYTLVFGNAGPNGVISLMRKVPYDLQKDLRPISTVAIAPLILAVRSDLPVKTVKDFVAYAKEQGDKMTYGSVGTGSLSHLTGEYFNHLAGTHMLHSPYNGGAPMMTAFLSGDIHAAFVTGLDGATLAQSGKVRYLGVGTLQQSEALPELPVIADAVPGFKSSSWFGVLGPKGLPDPIANRLTSVINDILKRPDVRQKLIDRKVEPHASTSQELSNLIKENMEQWGPVVKKANIVM